MLCRTANELYWMSRHIERAENTARLIDLTQRIALLPERFERGAAGITVWGKALEAFGIEKEYAHLYGAVNAQKVLRFMIFDALNPSSIYSCLQSARESARSQRGAITAEMYEDLNSSWLSIRALSWEQLVSDGLQVFLDRVKQRSASFRGITIGTMGRDEAYHFLSLGTFIERADCTVRLLDIKYSVPGAGDKHEARNAVDYYQWSSMLHAISAFETYRRIYKDTVRPERVAELLILREDMPRSLVVCSVAIHNILSSLMHGERAEVVRQAGALAAEMRYGRIDAILEQGMQAYLDGYIERLYRLADEVNREFMTSTDRIAA